MARSKNMAGLEAEVARLPETVRVEVEAWGDTPTFRVRGKNFVFTDEAVTGIGFKLSKDEAEAVVATDNCALPWGTASGATAGSPSIWSPMSATSGGLR